MSLEETGKKIQSIKFGKRKVLVRFADGDELSFSKNAFTEQPLYAEKVLSQDEYKALLVLASEDKITNAVLRYAVKELHTKHETIQYLYGKGADEKTAYRLINKLEEEGLINDELYATTYARDVAGVKLYGRNRVLFDLKHKGIGDEILSSLQFDELTELSKARKFAALANKKYAKNTNTKKMYKVTSALLRRGFDEHIAQEAARLEFVMGDPELELERLKAEAQRVKARYSKKYHGYDLTRRVALSLARKGYPYEDIKAALEEFDHEDYGND